MTQEKQTIELYSVIQEAENPAIKNTLIALMDGLLGDENLTDVQKGELARVRSKIITEVSEF